jgi:uncharacterized protein YdcH (DUF465 family)
MREIQNIRRLSNEHEELDDKILRGEIESEQAIERQQIIMEEIKEITENIINNNKLC